MKTNRIFIGYSKTGKELLLYQKAVNIYIDLLSKHNNIFPIENIDFLSLIPVSRSLDFKKNMLKHFIKSKYNKDRQTIMDTDKIIYGRKFKIINLKKRFYSTDTHDVESYSFKSMFQHSSIFIYTRNLTLNYKLYKDISDEKEYLLINKNFSKSEVPISYLGIDEGTEYVELSSNNLKDIVKKAYLSKKEVHELAYSIKKKSLNKERRS